MRYFSLLLSHREKTEEVMAIARQCQIDSYITKIKHSKRIEVYVNYGEWKKDVSETMSSALLSQK